MKKWLKISLLSVLGLIVVAGVFTWIEFGSIIQGALSAEKLDDGMYYMEYKGDDGFKELMKRGGSKGINDLADYTTEFLSKGFFKTAKIDCPVMPVGCSTLTVRTPEGGAMMARNFDYPYGTAMIMHTVPDEGYESITTFSTDFYGFGEDYKPEGFKNQYMALAGLFMALDGINEKGFAIAVLDAGDKVVTNQDTSKPDLTTTSATQYLLKNAANVDEALELLRGIDMNSDPGSAYHYSMADASGRSVAVEYVDNRMVVTESPFVTNHYLCEEKFQVGLHEGDHRHEKLMEQYDKAAIKRAESQVGLGFSEREQARPEVRAGGVMSEKELTDAIISVTQLPEKGAIVGGTLWTMVMDLTHPSVTYYSCRHFDKPFRFELKRQKDI